MNQYSELPEWMKEEYKEMVRVMGDLLKNVSCSYEKKKYLDGIVLKYKRKTFDLEVTK